VEATLLNTAANLLTTAAAGYAFFYETLHFRLEPTELVFANQLRSGIDYLAP
jgi:hypothetical protein